MTTYYKVILALIKKNRTVDLEDKINILWLDGKLTDDERNELVGLLHPKTEAESE